MPQLPYGFKRQDIINLYSKSKKILSVMVYPLHIVYLYFL